MGPRGSMQRREHEEEGAKHRTLGDSVRQWGCVRVGFIETNDPVAV